MAIIAKDNSSGGDYFEASPQGVHRAICCDVVDRGMVPGKFGEKHLVRLVWQLETLMQDGRPYLIDRNYTLSLGERAALRHDLETWAGKPLTLEQAAGFDLERLIGVTCTLLIVHKAGRDGTRIFSNISAIMPKQPGAPLVVRDYVRVAHRTQTVPPAAPKPVGPSFAPPPQGWPPVLPQPGVWREAKQARADAVAAAEGAAKPQPEPDAFDSGPTGTSTVSGVASGPMTADDIPF